MVHNCLNLSTIFVNSKGEVKIDYLSLNSRKISKNEIQDNGFYYYCPESLTKGKCTMKNDIWAIGCIALSLVFGKKIHLET